MPGILIYDASQFKVGLVVIICNFHVSTEIPQLCVAEVHMSNVTHNDHVCLVIVNSTLNCLANLYFAYRVLVDRFTWLHMGIRSLLILSLRPVGKFRSTTGYPSVHLPLG